MFPVIYVTQCGIYKCKLSFFDIHVHELEFVLSEEGWCKAYYLIVFIPVLIPGDNRTWKVTVMFNTSSANLGMSVHVPRVCWSEAHYPLVQLIFYGYCVQLKQNTLALLFYVQCLSTVLAAGFTVV